MLDWEGNFVHCRRILRNGSGVFYDFLRKEKAVTGMPEVIYQRML